MNALKLLLVGALVAILSACGSAVEDSEEPIVIDFEPVDQKADTIDEPEPEPQPTLADRDCPDDSVLTYDNFGGPFMRNWCTGCHNSELPEGERAQATLGVDLETRELIVDWADRVWFRSADANRTMPPGGGPTDEEREQLGEWLACGAP